VAEALNCTEGTVKSNASRGLERLRAVLGPVLVAEGEQR
jgi:DNA-directed RNA polymerase specialized sigma24 family protein